MSDKHDPTPTENAFADTLLALANEGMVEIDGDTIRLTDKGRAAAREAEVNVLGGTKE